MIRPASHAGSWYTSSKQELNQSITECVNNTNSVTQLSKVGVSPHAGYRFCLDVGVDVYRRLAPVNHIIVLAPLHRIYSKNALTTQFDEFETPLGNLNVNKLLINEFINSGHCEFMDKEIDVLEHSFEMQLPLIKYFHPNATVTPLFLGLGNKNLIEVMSRKLELEDYAFVVSSDFCHYGSNFQYTPFESPGIYAQIERMDKQGMKEINLGYKNFKDYLEETDNTICGQFPLLFLLRCCDKAGLKLDLDWTKYKQSSKVQKNSEFSVSYAAGTGIFSK